MNKKCCYIICSLIVTSIISLVLGNAKAFATTTCVTDQSGLETCTDSETGAKTYTRTATVNTSVTIGYSCRLESVNLTAYTTREFTAVLLNGESVEVGGASTSSTFVECNDASGYAVYAVGYSGDSIGNTDLISSAGSSYNIHTDGANSYWKMKLSTNGGNPPTIPTDYLSYHNIPSTYTKVAYFNGPSGGFLSSSFNTHYQAHAAIDQPAGDFVGKVKYVLVAPASAEPINIDSAFASAGKTKYNGYYKMQDMSTSICANVTAIDDEARLIDVRDDKVYYVTKLKDGNCWMTQNLYHDIDSSYDYGSDNTDVPDDWDEELNDTYVASSHVYNNWNDEPFSRLGYDECWTGSTGSIPCINGNYHYHRGTYYNWTAAIASEDSSDFDGEVADQSICPAGWTLPSPTNYSNLISLYSDLTKSPTYFPLVGYVYTTITAFMGSDTGYWTNKSTNTESAKDLYLTSLQSGGGQSLSDNSRAYALSIRCIAR